MPDKQIGDYADLDIAALLRSAAEQSMFGEGDPRRTLNLPGLDYQLRQYSTEFTVRGLGEYLKTLDKSQRWRLLSAYYLPGEWKDLQSRE